MMFKKDDLKREEISISPGTMVITSTIIPDECCMKHVTADGCGWRSVKEGDVFLVIASRPDKFELELLHMRCQMMITTNDVTFWWVMPLE